MRIDMDNTVGLEIARLLEASAKISTALLELSEEYSTLMDKEMSWAEFVPPPLKVISND
jgi:hypothetical protein|tara:strand:- start:1008 stop:1184 length:177 start_codon:yes stop_codon:yes gene_type:complete